MVSESRLYTVGPVLEFKLWRRLGVEIDTLYKRVGKSQFTRDFVGDVF